MTTPYIYRLAAGTDLFDLLDDFKTVMNPVRDLLDARMIAEMAVHLVDKADLSGEPRPWVSPWNHAWGIHREEQLRTSPDRRDFDPNSLTLTVGRDRLTSHLLVRLVFDGHREYPEMFEALPAVEAYWTTGERERDAEFNSIPTEQDLSWARVAGTRRAGASMYSYPLRTEYDRRGQELDETPEGRALILAEAPSLETRVTEHAHQAVIDGMLAGIDTPDLVNDFMTAMRRSSRADLSATREVIRGRLAKVNEALLFETFTSATAGHQQFRERLAVAVAADISTNKLDLQHGPRSL